MSEELVRNTTVSVGTTSVEVSPQLMQGQRKVLVLTNTSTSGQILSIYFSNADSAVSLRSIVLYPTGSWYEASDSGFQCTNLRCTAISDGASGTLAVHERVSR